MAKPSEESNIVLLKFIKPVVIRNATALAEVDFGPENQLSDLDMFIGFVTRQKLLKLERKGDPSPAVSKKFLHFVYRQFLKNYNSCLSMSSQDFPLLMND